MTWSGDGCLGGRRTGDLYPGPWAGVAVCCYGSCGGYLHRQGLIGFLFSLFLSVAWVWRSLAII